MVSAVFGDDWISDSPRKTKAFSRWIESMEHEILEDMI